MNLCAALRIVVATMLVCCVVYPGLILLAGWTLVPQAAAGSLVRDAQGRVVGSALIAQAFAQPGYFWPRPSAVSFNGAGAGGSNLSPASPKLRARVADALPPLVESGQGDVPADLVMASGSGLDPDISVRGALYQVPRVAHARGLAPDRVRRLIESQARRPGGPLTPDPLVNVLRLNLALDGLR